MSEEIKDQNSYSRILKRLSAFGGVQVFSILLNLIRGKFVAILLGPNGMGLSSLFMSSTGTLQQLAGLGLNLVMVKEVAAGKERGDSVSLILAVSLRLIYLTSLLGAILCFLLSPLLSLWSFGNYDYTLSFMVLSAGVALAIGGAGYLALLQGLGEVKRLSKASIVGGIAGLAGGVPLYYFFGVWGIVPAIVISSLAIFLFYWFSFRNSVTYDRVKFRWNDHRPMIRRLVSLGLILMVGSLSGTLTNYLINVFIRAVGSVDDVGLFQAANSVTNQYVGVVFSAMALDYFPRLSAVSHDAVRLRDVVNRQMEIVTLVVTPLILILLWSAPLVIRILLDEKFMSIIPLMRWLGFGVLLQAVSFPMGYIFIARDNRKVYIWMEVIFTNILWIVCSIGFYYLYGLVGLGVSLVVRAGIDIFVVYQVCRRFYGYSFNRKVSLTVAVCLLMGAVGFAASLCPDTDFFIILPVMLGVSAIYSATMLIRGVKS